MNLEIEKDDDFCDFYKLTQEDLRNADITRWYTSFETVTIETAFYAVGPSMLAYFRSNSLYHQTEWTTTKWAMVSDDGDEWSDSDDGVSDSSNRSEDQNGSDLNTRFVPQDILKDCDKFMVKAIAEMGGSVYPKLNWQSPKDALWAALNKSLRCYSPGDIFSIFKLSYAIREFAMYPFVACDNENVDVQPLEYKIVLRRWISNLRADGEFRCFVCDKKLTAICQRDANNGFAGIADIRDDIIKDIHDFFCDFIYQKFPSNYYVFDVARLKPREVILVDFEVFGLPTDPILFSYRELKLLMVEIESNLQAIEDDSVTRSGLKNVKKYGEPYFRYLSESSEIRPIAAYSAAPMDITTYLREVIGGE